ncbi:MAG: diguanylate cyclase [bacterium]
MADSSTKRRVIFVDDEGRVLEGIQRSLDEYLDRWSMEYFPSARSAMAYLAEFGNAVVVSDWLMPGMSGLQFLRELRERERLEDGGRNYFILLTGKRDNQSLVEGLVAGADDFVRKPFDPRVLTARIEVGLRLLQMENELRSARCEMEYLATIDPLTRLLNRRRGTKILDAELSRVSRGLQELSVILMDLDRFKRVNDSWGHDAGDAVLEEVARRIGDTSRKYDSAIRWGGEEILLLCPHTGTNEIQYSAERLRREIGGYPYEIPGGETVFVTASLGTATVVRGKKISGEELIAVADTALHEAKESGCDCVRLGADLVPQ